MKKKICTKCKLSKLLKEFCLDKKAKDGKQSWCKECYDINNKKYYLKHKEKIKIQNKKYRDKHKEERNSYNKKYNQKHREEIKIYQKKYNKKYYQEHKKELNIRNKKYRDGHKGDIKKYKQEHKEDRNKYESKRRKTDTIYKTTISLRNRICLAIKGNTKSLSTMFLIGCEIEYLLLHLQSQFTKDMTWDNYGTGFNGNGLKEWHIDHIRPCASFDLSKPSQQRKCFNYKNLQPLWAKDNLIKSNKWK